MLPGRISGAPLHPLCAGVFREAGEERAYFGPPGSLDPWSLLWGVVVAGVAATAVQLGAARSADLVASCSLRAIIKTASLIVRAGDPVLRACRRRIVVFPSGGVGLVSWCVGVSSGSPPSSFAAACEDGGLWLPVLLRRGASLSCGCAITEDGDFPAASNLVIRTKVSSVPPGGSADAGAAACPRPASKIVPSTSGKPLFSPGWAGPLVPVGANRD